LREQHYNIGLILMNINRHWHGMRNQQRRLQAYRPTCNFTTEPFCTVSVTKMQII